MNSRGDDVTALIEGELPTEPDACSLGRPTWSPDGERLLFELSFRYDCRTFAVCRGTGKEGLYTLSADGKDLNYAPVDPDAADPDYRWATP